MRYVSLNTLKVSLFLVKVFLGITNLFENGILELSSIRVHIFLKTSKRKTSQISGVHDI